MKNLNQFLTQDFAESKAMQAIDLITKWIDERYPQLTPTTKAKIISQCLREIKEERLKLLHLN